MITYTKSFVIKSVLDFRIEYEIKSLSFPKYCEHFTAILSTKYLFNNTSSMLNKELLSLNIMKINLKKSIIPREMKCSVLHSQFYFNSDNWYFVKSPLREDPSYTRNSASHGKTNQQNPEQAS